MLDIGRNLDQNGHPIVVQPANFLRAFRTLPEAAAMGLLLPDTHPEIKRKNTLPRLAQSWARFILQQLSSETQSGKSGSEQSKTGATMSVKKIIETSAVPETERVEGAGAEDTENEQTEHPIETKPETETADVNEPTERLAETSPIAKFFGLEQEQVSRCTKCGTENSKLSTILLSSLMLQDIEGLPIKSFNQNHLMTPLSLQVNTVSKTSWKKA